MNYKDKLKTIPKEPGCYQYYDASNTIIYVGKAKNLYNRMNSYFIGAHDAKTTKMVSQIDHFEYIITSSEVEAFILEINLIKKYSPKYNILLTDDKSYPYICLTQEKHPRLIYSREIKKRKNKVYGPYPNAKAAKETVELLNRIYPLRKCNNMPKKECLYYHIGQCLGPCINKIDNSTYQDIERKITLVLKGNVKEEIKRLENQMMICSNNLDFEKAIMYRENINSLQVISEHQKMEGLKDDLDCFAYYDNEKYLSIQIFHLRQGKMIERKGYLFDRTDSIEQFQSFISQFYLVNNNPLPKLIYVPQMDVSILEKALNHKINIPKKGKNLELINLVKANAKQRIDVLIKNKEIEYNKTIHVMDELSELLGLEKLHTIEAFDNSNISGVNPVSAMVCFVDGKPCKSKYRKYKIKTVVGSNESATMMEVVTRRYKQLLNLPDLIIMDGGKVQVNSCKKALKEIDVEIPVIGLVKNSDHETDHILYEGKEYHLEKNTFLFRFLSTVQEEVHRFAITYFRNTHSTNSLSSQLEKIKGIGKVKRNQILKLLNEPDFEKALNTTNLTKNQKEEILKIINK